MYRRSIAAEVDSAQVQAALRQVAQSVEPALEEMAARAAIAMHEGVEEFPDDDTSRRWTTLAYLESLRLFVGALGRGAPASSVVLGPRNLASARALARSTASLKVMMQMLHIAHRSLSYEWNEQVTELPLPPEVADVTRRRANELMFEWVEATEKQLVVEFEQERRRWAGSPDALRAEAVRAILAGERVDIAAESRTLGYELERHHVAFVLWRTDDHPDNPPLAAAASSIAEMVGATRPLIAHGPERRVRMWIGGHDAPSLDGLSGRLPAGCSVAVGEPAHGVAGFRESLRDAESAARVAVLSHRRPNSVTRFRNVEVGALLVDDLPRIRRFVRRELAGLSYDDDESARLRATLKVYLEEQASRQAVSSRLGIHSNTVANRVKRCRELLDREFSARHVELGLALTLAEILGPAVLEPAPAGP